MGATCILGFGETIFKGQGVFQIHNVEAENYDLTENHFTVPLVTFKSKSLSNSTVEIRDNTFDQHVALSISSLPDDAILDWAQFAGKNFSAAKIWDGFSSIYEQDSIDTQGMFIADLFTQDYLERFVNHTIIEDEFYYNEEQKLKGYLIQFYKSQNNLKSANAVYVESKDLETRRLAYEYRSDPSFNAFFTLKINQFLKTFSAYGTEPARAVIYSMYVILFFAFFYLFFPNS